MARSSHPSSRSRCLREVTLFPPSGPERQLALSLYGVHYGCPYKFTAISDWIENYVASPRYCCISPIAESRVKYDTAGRRSGHSTEMRGKMASNSDRARRELSHFHACVHCGNVSRRDEFDGTAVATGIYPCTKCGQDGPLNIVIRDVDAAAIGTSDPASSSSAG